MSTLYVAEIGSVHKQNVSLACEMARQLKDAGCDILKVQFGHEPSDPVRHVSEEFAHTLNRYCLSIGLEFMASIFSFEGLALARELHMKRYKIAAPVPFKKHGGTDALQKAILSDGKETFISYSDEDGGWTPHPHRRPIWTVSQYPTYPWQVQWPESGFGGTWYGYSDHCHGIGACLLAVSRGARYIEKHVCLDKTDLWTKDTSFSATPAEFAELTRLGREIERVRDAVS